MAEEGKALYLHQLILWYSRLLTLLMPILSLDFPETLMYCFFLCCVVGGMVPGLFKLTKLCKFCDEEPSSCNGTGTCQANCSITSICEHSDEVCVAVWYVKALFFLYNKV